MCFLCRRQSISNGGITQALLTREAIKVLARLKVSGCCFNLSYLRQSICIHFFLLHNNISLWYKGASQVPPVVKIPLANAGDLRDVGSIPGLERSPGEEHGIPLQYSCLENPMNRGVWRAIVLRVAESNTEATQHVCTCTKAFKADLSIGSKPSS